MPQFTHPELYALWKSHDLSPNFKSSSFKHLSQDEEHEIWSFIEIRYLAKYTRFIRFECEWGSEGIWAIPFPGSTSMSGAYSLNDLKIPSLLANQIRGWHQNWEDNAKPWEPQNNFDYAVHNQVGLELALKSKIYFDSDVYIEYYPFRELILIDNDPILADIPSEISKFTTYEQRP